ncbi:mitogen-activated protein kinase kinase kinase 1-like isoform X2 [Mytilus trossulus]|uniref:mitogen-activated protein kinase kinase kinase 1-like isoform X1 n=1 Tax=Mytilus trossulus TaxID=6551 RepID=UPI003004F682
MESATLANDDAETSKQSQTNCFFFEDTDFKPNCIDSEEYLGPHDWRKILRPIEDGNLKSQSARCESNEDQRIATNLSVTESENKAIKDSRKIHNEDSKLNEKPKRVPSWKRHLIEKKKNKSGKLVRNGSGAGSQDGGGVMRKKSFNRNVDSTFKQQVVNSNNLSQSNSFRRRISPSNSFNKQSQGSSLLTKNRIEKVQRARLYLLQQNGPNSFLIGGDSPDHKFRVIIGPQTCSCGKGPHCVHVLFVMLRVFKVQEGDPCLWSRTLKNYEVESLFRIYQNKVSLRISKKRKEKENKKGSSSESVSPEVTPTQSEIGSVKEEEDTCPICLLEMLEGESLLKCENGCQNRLHHHCIAVWFELCRRQNDPLICPLCRAKWKANTFEVKSHEEPVSREPPGAPPNTRAPSPQPQASAAETRLPYADPVPSEFKEMASPWIEVFGEDLVSCFFTKNWSIRESALNHLSKEVQAVLMRGMGEGRSGVLVSPERQTATHTTLECCCQILAFMSNDPVYRVYVASLRTLRTILSYTPCREQHQKLRLERLLKSIVDAVAIKCTDGNRRTSQLSLSTIVEIGKGQDGELAVGKEIHNSGGHGLHGLDYIIKCMTEDYDGESVAWQWLLGRLYVLERLFEEFHNELLPRNPPDGRSADEEGPAPSSKSRDVYHKPSVQDRLLAIARFAIKGVSNSHMRISRMSRRVFLLVCRFSAHIESMIDDLEEMLTAIDTNVGANMKKRLWRIVNDFQLSEKIVQELHHGIRNSQHSDDSPTVTPVSTPRCNSPVTHLDGEACTTRPLPTAPPNTPIHSRRKQKSKRTPSLKVEEEGKETIDGVSNKLSEVLNNEITDTVNPPAQSPDKNPPPIPPRPSSRRGSYEILETGPILTPPPPISRISSTVIQKNNISPGLLETDFPATPEEITEVHANKAVDTIEKRDIPHKKKLFLPLNTSDDVFEAPNPEDSTFVNPPSENNSTSNDLDLSGDICKVRTSSKIDDQSIQGSIEEHSKSFKTETDNTTESAVNSSDCVPLDSVVGQDLTGLDYAGTTEFQYSMSSDEKFLSSDDSLDRRKRRRSRLASSDCGLSSDELLNFDSPSSKGTPNREDRKVSFKSEVTSCPSPKHFPDNAVHNNNDKNGESCLCKEEIEKEEAIALAKALEVSSKDPPTPKIPGLTPTERELVITIRIQPDDYKSRDNNNDNDNAPKFYYEDVHWKKGPLLGTGAYSTCYQSRDVKTGVIMAVKQISFCRNSASEQEKVVETISEEIQMMAKLNHPNVVRILGATKQGCHFNMFLEWMPGGSISYLLSQYGIFSEDVMISYIFQTLRGLAYLHDNHILHRDLKGANLLVDSTGQRLRIGDFGAAARLASQTTGAGEFQGQLLGTIAFMAPEVLRGEEYGRACDIWSTGCTIIEMTSTNPPWDAKAVSNHLALIFKIATSMTPPPIPENLSPPIKDLALRCLETDKKDRPSAKDLLLHPVFTNYKPIR